MIGLVIRGSPMYPKVLVISVKIESNIVTSLVKFIVSVPLPFALAHTMARLRSVELATDVVKPSIFKAAEHKSNGRCS